MTTTTKTRNITAIDHEFAYTLGVGQQSHMFHTILDAALSFRDNLEVYEGSNGEIIELQLYSVLSFTYRLRELTNKFDDERDKTLDGDLIWALIDHFVDNMDRSLFFFRVDH